MKNVRPESLSDFVGQERVRRILEILCRSAKNNNRPVPHLLLAGPPGLGKSALAEIVGEEMASSTVTVIASNVQSPDQMLSILLGIKQGQILFLDELHGLNRSTEEVLYSALQDFRVSVPNTGYDGLMKQLGMASTNSTVEMKNLPPFTCIGATTLAGLVSSPLRSRFVQTLNLVPYSDMELTQIVLNAAKRIGLNLTEEVALSIAHRGRSSARVSLSHVRWVAEFCAADGCPPTDDVVEKAFALQGVDREGLTAADLSYLSALTSSDAPLGLSTLASIVGESKETLAEAVEPFLIQEGYVRKGPRGRVALQKAFDKVERTGTVVDA